MAEGNGMDRLDRVEAILDKVGDRLDRMGERLDKVATMGYLHDERLSRLEANVEQMQEDEAAYRNEQRERERRIEERIAAQREEQRERERSIDERIAVQREEQREREKRIDDRIGKLVSAIGELVRRPLAGD